MIEKNIKDYQNRITSADRQQLLVITYELFIEYVNEAIANIDNNEVFKNNLQYAKKYHGELVNGLDMSYEISKELLALYIYMNKKLIEASMNHDIQSLVEVKTLSNVLLDGWKNATLEEDKPLMQNTQKVYAGLTYGKGNLNEVVKNNKDRGFKA